MSSLLNKIKNLFFVILINVLFTACSSSQSIHTSSFNFVDYEYVYMANPPEKTSSFYGLDIKVANLLREHSIKAIGDKEFKTLSDNEKNRTLLMDIDIKSSDDRENIIVTLTLDDDATGKTEIAIISYTQGDIFKMRDGNKAAKNLLHQLQRTIFKNTGIK